jgi:hypothetical protein
MGLYGMTDRKILRENLLNVMDKGYRDAIIRGHWRVDEMMNAILEAMHDGNFIVCAREQYTHEMCLAGMNSYIEPLTAFDAIAAIGDLTRKPE